MEELDLFKMGYTALGGLGVFFLGLRSLSENLQRLTGTLIRRIINFATSNRIMAVIVGLGITVLIQSSSITTVMVVGLVNAGLMNLTQAVGVILGANIGTTITGWILAIKVGKYGLLLIGVGIFPLLMAKREKVVLFSQVVVALGLIFFGLELMSGAFKPLRSNDSFIGYLAYFDTNAWSGLLGCVAIGCCLTFIIQSSSAMLGITIALASTGALDFPTAAALVLGENIGTTITALLAGVGANRSAKRAAVSHAVFNVAGVTLIIICFQPFISIVDSLVPGAPDLLGADGGKPNMAQHIAMGHTLFNISATLVMLPFLSPFVRLIERILPLNDKEEDRTLQYIGKPGAMSSSVALNMASLELRELTKQVKKLMKRTDDYLALKQHDSGMFDEISHYEETADTVQKEMTAFVCQVMEGTLGNEESSLAYSLIRAADELESISDYCHSICRYRYRMFRYNQDFSVEGWNDINSFFAEVTQFCDLVFSALDEHDFRYSEKVYETASELNRHADELRDNHLARMRSGTCKALPALAFSDIAVAMRRVRNHSLNLFEALEFAEQRARSAGA